MMMICKEKKEISQVMSKKDEAKKRALSMIHRKYAASKSLTRQNLGQDEKNMEKALEQANDILIAFDANEPLTAMLAAQMAAIHELQQKAFTGARIVTDLNQQQTYINTITKLSNVFIQQAALMQKLQGKGQQKVTVEHVHVHDGGQAIVGNVEANLGGGVGNGQENGK